MQTITIDAALCSAEIIRDILAGALLAEQGWGVETTINITTEA